MRHRPHALLATRPGRSIAAAFLIGALALSAGCGDDSGDPQTPGDITTPPGASTVLEEPQATSPAGGSTGSSATPGSGGVVDSGGSTNSEVTPNTTPSQGG